MRCVKKFNFLTSVAGAAPLAGFPIQVNHEGQSYRPFYTSPDFPSKGDGCRFNIE